MDTTTTFGKRALMFVPRIIGTLSAAMAVFAVLFLMDLFVQVTADGLPLSGHTGVSSLIVTVVPISPAPHLAVLLVGALYWRESKFSEPTVVNLAGLAALALMGLVALAVGGEVYRRYSYLDGDIAPTPGRWVSTALLVFGLAAATYGSWRRRTR